MSKSKIYVSASDVSEAFFCTYRLKNKLDGKKVTTGSRLSSKRGDKKHDYQNRIGVDRRCFVSTYAYGSDDPRTKQLRRFRDQVLMPTFLGCLLIKFYYMASPLLIKLARKNILIDKGVKWLLSSITPLV